MKTKEESLLVELSTITKKLGWDICVISDDEHSENDEDAQVVGFLLFDANSKIVPEDLTEQQGVLVDVFTRSGEVH